jgi:hypothetical protein
MSSDLSQSITLHPASKPLSNAIENYQLRMLRNVCHKMFQCADVHGRAEYTHHDIAPLCQESIPLK